MTSHTRPLSLGEQPGGLGHDQTRPHDDLPEGFEAYAWEEHGPNAYALSTTKPVLTRDERSVLVPANTLIGIFGYAEARDIARAILEHERVVKLANVLDHAEAWPEDVDLEQRWAAEREMAELTHDHALLRGMALLARHYMQALAARQVTLPSRLVSNPED